MTNLPRSCAFAAVLLAATSVTAQTIVFATDFDGPLPAAVTPGAALLEGVQGFAGYGPPGNQFGGSFLRSPTGNTVTFQLSGLPAHNSIGLDFLFAAIDSLDGTGTPPAGDFLAIRIDGNLVFRESFANALTSQIQSYVPPPGVELARRVDLGFTGPGSFYTDSAYWLGADPQFVAIGHSQPTLTIEMRIEGPGIQSLNDESWAIDNLTIRVATVAAQGSVTAYGATCGPVLSAIGVPTIGSTLTNFVEGLPVNTVLPALAIGLSDTSLAGLPLPLSLAPLGAPGCLIHHDCAIDTATPMQPFGAIAISTIPVPASQGLVGFTCFLQGWGFAPGVNALGIATSNGVRVVIGQ